MGCGCGKRNYNPSSAAGSPANNKYSSGADEWGPAYWRILHCLAHRIGGFNDPVIDADQARSMEYLVTHLNEVIPCSECQTHSADYIRANPLELSGLRGATLRGTAELWLLNFHNDVRTRKGQSIIVATIDALVPLYDGCTISATTEDIITRSGNYGIDNGTIKAAPRKRWINEYKKLKLSGGA